MTNITLDDEALVSINTFDPTVHSNASFFPLGDVLTFLRAVGPDVNGDWTLRAVDDQGNSAGIINEWSLDVAVDLVESTLEVSDVPGEIRDLDVTVNITFPYAQDLSARLISPNGTGIPVKLFSNVGGENPNFTNTILDDEAGTPIDGSELPAAAPYTGHFRAQDLLSVFDGENISGCTDRNGIHGNQ